MKKRGSWGKRIKLIPFIGPLANLRIPKMGEILAKFLPRLQVAPFVNAKPIALTR